MKIVVVSHGHPAFSKGGAEISAYNLHNAYLEAGHDSSFIARVAPSAFDNVPIVNYAQNEFLLGINQHDSFNNLTESPQVIIRYYCNLIKKLNPEFIHFHHYSHLGLEIFQATRKVLPKVKMILTLHEYMAICPQAGQMIKMKEFELCSEENIYICHLCSSQWTTNQLFLRKQLFLETFKLIDFFIAPSYFLKERYIQWGLEKEKIYVIENGISQSFLNMSVKQCLHFPPSKPIIFGYFGQINKFKGILLLLQAFAALKDEIRKKAFLKIHGSGLEIQSKEYQEKFKKILKNNENNIIFSGRYETENLPGLLAAVHYVIMPSIWWENSPVVIQEAHTMKRPVICSDIGGMKEKVIHMKDGIHFRARNQMALTQTLTQAITTPNLHLELAKNCKKSPSALSSAIAVLNLFSGNKQ